MVIGAQLVSTVFFGVCVGEREECVCGKKHRTLKSFPQNKGNIYLGTTITLFKQFESICKLGKKHTQFS